VVMGEWKGCEFAFILSLAVFFNAKSMFSLCQYLFTWSP
jgi:hypothetical protein